jgi:hypothetical protein
LEFGGESRGNKAGLYCTSTLKQYNRHAITKLKHIMQAKSRKGAVKETRTEVAKKKLQLKHKNSLFTLQTFHYNNY